MLHVLIFFVDFIAKLSETLTLLRMQLQFEIPSLGFNRSVPIRLLSVGLAERAA